MTIRPLLVDLSLRAAQRRMGFRPAAYARLHVYPQDGHAAPDGRVNARHVVVGRQWLDLHEYSSDMRETPDRLQRFACLADLVRHVCAERIDQACTTYMAGNFNVARCVAEGRTEAMFGARDRYGAELLRRLDAYLHSPMFRLYDRAVGLRPALRA